MATEIFRKIIFGDNLPILEQMKSESIDLIYIDPPFNTGKIQSLTRIKTVRSEDGNRKGFNGNSYETITIGKKEYNDDFGDDFVEEFLYPRLIEAYRLLAPNGSLYFHIDYREVHYCKILLDRIFGRENFINEIIWAYDFGGKAKSRWPAKHDNILYYVKNSENYIFNSAAVDREPYMAPGLVGPEKALKGKLPTDTWWHTIVGTNSKEKTGYPTQKPLGVINRIIQASSLPGQTVLDFFAGSGTTGQSCIKLNRNFILIDNNKDALEVMAKRFTSTPRIEWVNFDPRPFQSQGYVSTRPTQGDYEDDFEMLVTLASSFRNELEEQTELWSDSPFSWITRLAAAKKGKLGRNLIETWFGVKGFVFDHPHDKKANLVFNGIRIATKFSTLWSEGSYKFQQIRGDGYDHLICLGISPTKVHCWMVPREIALKVAKTQHSGSDLILTIYPDNPPEWSGTAGGRLGDVETILKNFMAVNKSD